ncbi:MAG: tRNA (adenosine(37)-N6)-threonylcarbamoyltransferase complex dimerization subunit type 1 TsaB [Bacteroidales bacterium]|nr:tRNA (adenosine(37)-N6)-threonylcarbamoyltransferase complex dimerization subunit type 1 TsaB [Bacteroidales bacterium]
MTLILSIETATPVCSVALAKDHEVLAIKESAKKNSHSEIVTVFIDELMKENQISFKDLDVVAVSKGPGSYTGLRIGVSTAKGLCYALDIPLIAVNTLQSLSIGASKDYQFDEGLPVLFCPMIDARRMEVYCALFDKNNREVRKTKAEIIEPDSFQTYLESNKVIFFGDGANKCKEVIQNPNAVFLENVFPTAKNMAGIALDKFKNQVFEDVAYFEPFYLKDFIAGVSKVKGLK